MQLFQTQKVASWEGSVVAMKQDNPTVWSRDLQGSEHPETARLRLGKETIDQLTAIKRESMDNIYRYINDLVDKAKEELQHARAASNDHRKTLLAQHIDELVAYLKGHNIELDLPRLAPPDDDKKAPRSYVLDDVSGFFGQVRCIVDQWHSNHLDKVLKEVTILQNLQERTSRQRRAASQE
jgi:hypothetical protein